jgi:hypothetical protein
MSSIREFASKLRALPLVVAIKVAEDVAPALTAKAKGSFDRSETPYGVPWEPGVDGQKITLRKTGALESTLRYVAIGTRLRVALGTSYAKYQIGKRHVFPAQGGELPTEYQEALTTSTQKVAKDALR